MGFDEDGVSDFRFVPAANFGEELFCDEGLELRPASLAEDLVATIFGKLSPSRQRHGTILDYGGRREFSRERGKFRKGRSDVRDEAAAHCISLVNVTS